MSEGSQYEEKESKACPGHTVERLSRLMRVEVR